MPSQVQNVWQNRLAKSLVQILSSYFFDLYIGPMLHQGDRLELEEITANWEIPRYCDLQSSLHVMQTVSVGEMIYQSGIPQFRYFSSI